MPAVPKCGWGFGVIDRPSGACTVGSGPAATKRGGPTGVHAFEIAACVDNGGVGGHIAARGALGRCKGQALYSTGKMLHPAQELEPPANPARFRQREPVYINTASRVRRRMISGFLPRLKAGSPDTACRQTGRAGLRCQRPSQVVFRRFRPNMIPSMASYHRDGTSIVQGPSIRALEWA